VAGGALNVTSIGNANGAVPYIGVPQRIRCKKGTTIVFATTGTFTTVTYNAEASAARVELDGRSRADSQRGAIRNTSSARRASRRRAPSSGDRSARDVGHADGRALLWALIAPREHLRSVFHRDGRDGVQRGRQDFGHELMAEIIAADSALYLLMEREARERDTRDDAAVDAAQIPSADTQERRNESS
jgi:hypothetical protein